MRSVLVTGGAGFIGSNFIRYVMRADPEATIVNLDALTYAGSLDNLQDLPDSGKHIFLEGDIRDPVLVEGVLREHRIDTIVHLAAESHVDRSILGPAPFIQTNIMGTFSLLEAARRVWIEDKTVPVDRARFHHVSTDEVFGSLGPDDPAFSESTPYAPNSPYAASKASSDHLVRAYVHTYGLPITISNCSNNYGPYQFPEKFIPLMILNAMEGKPLPIYGDGRQIRDWLYVEDHCEAIWKVLREGRPGETYNMGGDSQPTNLDLARRLCALLDEMLPESAHVPHASLIEYVADRPGHDRRYAMDNTKIKGELDWAPHETLESGLHKTVEWYLANPDWVRSIRERPNFKEWYEQNYIERDAAL
ncbi:MAG: dTDP-glucose 4,6-dehydratase [Anaerolineae bacterium]|nr:MAG: dTDP-glucose 4,6-dehydratase [Anaerolineae bacterium]